MAKLDKGTWVLVADSQKAVILKNLASHWNPSLKTLSTLEAEPMGATSDKPGRRPDSGPNQMSAMELPDTQKLTRQKFAREIAEYLYGRVQNRAFDKLVVVAAPQVLGALRDALHPSVAGRVIGEIRKSLTGRNPRDLEGLVKAGLDAA